MPKLLDFGIARVLDPESSKTADATVSSERILTLEYASPEHVRGEPTGIPSDVYSLGVVLYLLLARAHPYLASRTTQAELERLVCEAVPSRPSVAAGAEAQGTTRWSRSLRGDLDNIVLRALDKEPGRRYGSAEELAADIKRHLKGLPVLARPDTLLYRSSKFVRRHKPVVAGVTVAAMMLVLAAVGTSVGMLRAIQSEREAQDARIQAEHQVAKTRRVNEFLAGILSFANPTRSPNHDMSVRDALELAVNEAERTFDGEGDILGVIHHAAGKAYRDLGHYDRALEYLSGSVEEFELSIGLDHSDTLDARTDYALVLHDLGRFDDALSELQDLVEDQRRVLGARDEITLRALNNLGWLYLSREQPELALPVLGEAYDGCASILGEEHRMTMKLLANRAFALVRLGRGAEAEPLAMRSVELHERILGADSYDTLYARAVLAEALLLNGELLSGAQAFEALVRDAQSTLGADHPTTIYWTASHGWALLDLEEFHEAEQIFIRALEAHVSLQSGDHPMTARGPSGTRGGSAGPGSCAGRRIHGDPLYRDLPRGLGC